jgi:hypothetical protein
MTATRQWIPVRLRLDTQDRHRWVTWFAVAGLAAGAVMAVAGLPPVDLHGLAHYAGVMDPLCGGTRSVHALLRGQFADAWRYNPISFVVVGGATAVLIRHAIGWSTRRWLTVTIIRRRPVVVLLAALTVALGINQQAHAELLATRPGPLAMVTMPLLNLSVAIGGYVLIRRWTAKPPHRPDARGAI